MTTAIGLGHALIFTLVLCFVGSVKWQRKKVVQDRQNQETMELNSL